MLPVLFCCHAATHQEVVLARKLVFSKHMAHVVQVQVLSLNTTDTADPCSTKQGCDITLICMLYSRQYKESL
jgi:hypothetical protein